MNGLQAGGAWRDGIGWYGEPGAVVPFTVVPPATYRVKGEFPNRRGYTVTGTMRHVRDDPLTIDVLAVNVTDVWTGATITFPADGPATAALPVDLAPADVAQLWRVGRILAAQARAEVGRPSAAAERIEAIVDAAREFGPSATRLRVAQALGRCDGWDIEQADYKRDVRAAGGWREIKHRAGF